MRRHGVGNLRDLRAKHHAPNTAANARRFLRDLERAQTGKHQFDRLCAELDIEHRLTPPRPSQSKGMVERFPSCLMFIPALM